MTTFEPETLLLLRGTQEVRIETSAGSGRPVHRTIIWIVVDESRRVLVRSFLGKRGRWYRELLANPTGAVHVGGRRIAVRAEMADDADRIEACSRGLRAKYRPGRSLDSMLLPEVLPTTLELHPA